MEKKTKVTKNLNELDKVVEMCKNKKDTLLAIYGLKLNDEESQINLRLTGKNKLISDGFAKIIENALSKNAEKDEIDVANIFLNAISKVLEKGDEKSHKFADLLELAVERAQFKCLVNHIFDDVDK